MKIPVYLIVSSTGLPANSLTFTGSELEVSLDGGAWQTPGGTAPEVAGSGNGAGLYLYTPDVTESAARMFALRVVKTGIDPYGFETIFPMVADVDVNAVDAARRRVYLFVATSVNGLVAPVTGATPSAGQLQVSIDGGAWADGTGTWTEIGDGYYTYDLANADIATTAIVFVRCTIGQQAVQWIYVGVEVVVVVPPAPVEVAVSFGEPGYVDHVLLAVDRLPQQYRSVG